MSKFNKFTENLMKVMLVPDETSDTHSPVSTITPEPPDIFSKTASDYANQIDPQEYDYSDDYESPCQASYEDDDESEEDESDIKVTQDTTGLKLSFDGLDINLPNNVVEKIKDFLMDGEEEEEDEDDDEDEDEEEEVHSESKTQKKKNKFVNPYAVCNSSVGKEDEEKFDSCVKSVKSKFKKKK